MLSNIKPKVIAKDTTSMLGSFWAWFYSKKTPEEEEAKYFLTSYPSGEGLSMLLDSKKGDADVLELFLRGLKKKWSENKEEFKEIYLPNSIGANPLNRCVISSDQSKLAILLEHGAKPNRHFHINDGKKTYLHTPPLLFALSDDIIKPSVRLLILYGATLEQIPIDKLTEKDKVRYDKLTPEALAFYQQVCKECQELQQWENTAQKAKEAVENSSDYTLYRQAYDAYAEIGDRYQYFAEHNEGENDISRKSLQLFYTRQALHFYNLAADCLWDLYNQFHFTQSEKDTLLNDLKTFLDQVLENSKIVWIHPLYREDLIHCKNLLREVRLEMGADSPQSKQSDSYYDDNKQDGSSVPLLEHDRMEHKKRM